MTETEKSTGVLLDELVTALRENNMTPMDLVAIAKSEEIRRGLESIKAKIQQQRHSDNPADVLEVIRHDMNQELISGADGYLEACKKDPDCRFLHFLEEEKSGRVKAVDFRYNPPTYDNLVPPSPQPVIPAGFSPLYMSPAAAIPKPKPEHEVPSMKYTSLPALRERALRQLGGLLEGLLSPTSNTKILEIVGLTTGEIQDGLGTLRIRVDQLRPSIPDLLQEIEREIKECCK